MKTQNPVIGRMKGSAGGMTGSKVYDKNVLRAKAMEVNNPRTTAQVTQRNFFAQVQAIASTVTNEQLRSLFGIKPKAMSRRNALAAQIAEAYGVNGTTKSVDFSKLGGIGSGEKVTTPYVEFSNNTTTDNTTITAAMLNVAEGQDPNLILVAFDKDNDKIILINTENTLSQDVSTAVLVANNLTNFNGFAYVTCESKGEDVSDKGFGSFIIKVRPEKKGKDVQKGSADTEIVAVFSGVTQDSSVMLDFSNFGFNNLQPAKMYQKTSGGEVELANHIDWSSRDNNQWEADILAAYNPDLPLYLEIVQNSSYIETVPVTASVQ